MPHTSAIRAAALLLAMFLGVAACGDDAGPSRAEREWCAFTGASEEDAARFDVIFEVGLGDHPLTAMRSRMFAHS